MENKKTRSFRSRNARRRISGFLASVLVFVFVFEQFFMSLSYAATAGNLASASDAVRSGKISWKDSGAGEVQLAVLSDEALYEAGDQVCLDVYIKNNTDQEIYDGLLKFKAGGILEDSVYFEDVGTVYQEQQEDVEPEDKASEDEEPQDGIADDEDSQDRIADDEASEGGKTEGEGTSDGKASEDEGYAGELSYTVSKPVTKEDTAGDDEEMMDGGEDEEIDLSRVSDLILEPGEIRYVQFYFTIDDEIEGNKSQTIKFTFSGKTENKSVSTKETFRYVVGAMNLLPVEIGNEGKVAAGETARMRLSFELGEIEDMIMEREMELGISHKAANAKIDWASPSDASASDADRDDGDDSSGDGGSKLIKWDGEKADSGKKEDQPIIKNLKCTIDTPGLKLNGFKAEKQGDDEYGTSTICSFEVDEDAKPGVYFGQVTASYQIKSKKFQTTQSVMMTVSSDGRVEAEALTDDPEVLEVIRLIEGLPGEEEVTAKFAALEEDDEEGYEQCLTELYAQVMPVWEKYQALSDEQKEQVTNSEKLRMYEWLMAMPLDDLDGYGIFMVQFPRGTDGNKWTSLKWTSKTLNYLNGWSGFGGNKYVALHLDGGNNVNNVKGVYGKVAYCIEPGVNLNFKENLTSRLESDQWWKTGLGAYANRAKDAKGRALDGEKIKKIIGRIIAEGYNGEVSSEWQESDENKAKVCEAFATQLLVWETIVGERDLDTFDKLEVKDKSSVKDYIEDHDWESLIDDKYNHIEEEVKKHTKKPVFVHSAWRWNETQNRYEMTLTDQKEVLENYDVQSGNTNIVDCIKNGNNTITVYTKPGFTAGTQVTITIKNKKTVRCGLVVWGDGTYAGGDTGKQDVVTYSDKTTSDVVSVGEDVITPDNGITIEKKGNDTNKLLSGAEFKLTRYKDVNGKDVVDDFDTYTTNSEGKIILSTLKPGFYKLNETKAPQNYLLDPNEVTFTVNANGTVSDLGNSNTITVTDNREKASLSITKVVTKNDGQSQIPNGDRFTIEITFGNGSKAVGNSTKCIEGNSKHTFDVKDGETVVITDIPAGTSYIISEPKINGDEPAESGYQLITNDPNNPLSGTVEGNGLGNEVKLVTVTNHYFKSRTISIRGEKTWEIGNGENFIYPSSIEVQLFRTPKDGAEEWVATQTVQPNGEVWVYDFGEQDLYAAENVPYTYSVRETNIVYPEEEGYSVEPIDKKGNKFKILKEAENPSEGSTVVGVFVAEPKTDESSDSNPDNDQIKQTRILENTWMPAKNKGSLKFSIQKTDENGEIIEDGAGFEVYKDVNCEERAVYKKVESSDNHDGITVFKFDHKDLEVGSYYLKEEQAPDGYHKLAKPLEIKVSQKFTGSAGSDTSWENSWEWTAKIVDAKGLESDLNEIYRLENSRSKISIAKVLDFDQQPSEDYQAKEYIFDIYAGEEVDKDTKPVDTLYVKADGKAVETTKLLKNGRYTIIERSDNVNILNYTFKGMSVEGKNVGSGGFQVDINENTGTVEITATNSYTRNKADLLITKQIDYNKTTSYDPDPEQEFTVKVWLGSTEAEKPVRLGEDENVNQIPWAGEGSYTLHVKGSETAKITDIPVGTKYVIIETRVLNHSGEPDSRYTFGGIVLKKGTDANQPEEPSPADNAEDKPDVPDAGNGEDGSGLPNPDGTEANPPASEIPATEIIPAFQELRGEITDNGQEKWEEEVTVINRYHDQKLITIEGEKNWQNLNSQMITEDGLLPYSIHINLMRRPAASADGEETENTAELVHSHEIKVDDENKWKYTFADLPQYVENTEIPYEYFIVETGIQYDMEGSDDSPYMVEPIEGMDNLFKVSRKETTDGLHEVIGVFRVSYEKKDAVETEDGRTVQEIGINNTWEIALVENRGNAFLEITKEDSTDKKPLANAEFTLSVRDVDVIRRTDEEGKLTFGELPVGTYVMKETGAPDGYQKRDTQWTVTVSRQLAEVKPDEENPSRWINVWNWTTEVEGQEENGNQLTVENDRIQGSISLAKALVLDGQTNADPANQEKEYTFGIYRGTVFTGEPVETLTVKADGSTSISGQLDYGVYTISEIRRSDVEGHNWVGVTFSGAEDADKDAAGFQVMIAEQGETLAITAVNHYDREEEETTTTDGEEETTTGSEEETTTGGEEETTTGGDEESTTGREEETTTAPESSSAEETTAPVRGGGSGNGGGGGGGRDRDRTVTETVADENVPLANIDPEDVPLANLPNAPVTEEPLVVLDEDVPLVGLAKTGDRSVPIGALVGLLMVSLLGALGISRKRKEDENS